LQNSLIYQSNIINLNIVHCEFRPESIAAAWNK
jgi:hypothetical protein